MNTMPSKCYRLNQCSHRFNLYLGGFSTIEGLRLFPIETPIGCCELYTDARRVVLSDATTTKDAVDRLSSLPDLVHMVDFCCKIDSEIDFSTHDDGECHFTADSKDRIAMIVDQVSEAECEHLIWDTLSSHLGCYVVFRQDGTFAAYRDFEAYLASPDCG